MRSKSTGGRGSDQQRLKRDKRKRGDGKVFLTVLLSRLNVERGKKREKPRWEKAANRGNCIAGRISILGLCFESNAIIRTRAVEGALSLEVI